MYVISSFILIYNIEKGTKKKDDGGKEEKGRTEDQQKGRTVNQCGRDMTPLYLKLSKSPLILD